MQIEGFVNVSDVLRSGIYVLAYKGEVIYIGQSKRMLNRLAAHMSAWAAKRKAKQPHIIAKLGIYYDEVHIMPVHVDRLDEVERKLIDLYRPRLNVQHKRPGPSSAPFNLVIGGVSIPFRQPSVPEITRRV